MINRILLSAIVGATLATSALHAQIGLTELLALDPTLTGTGVHVAQPEATSETNNIDNNDFEVRPSAVSQPASLFTYINSTGLTSGTFPNAVGTESGHANTVGGLFYGGVNGVAPGVSHVDSYNATFFVNSIISSGSAIAAKVVNQSFVTGPQDASDDEDYDNYVATHGTIIVSGVGNGGATLSPSTAFNLIGVAAIKLTGTTPVGSSNGPTTDGRSKPDITAPADVTSDSTPLVAGAAAILVEAGNRNDGSFRAGRSTADETDPRTVKALLLNGAVKQFNSPNLPAWTHTSTAPLDTRQGAGVLNIFNSYKELAGGEQNFTISNTSQTPPGGSGSVAVHDAWNFSTDLVSSAIDDAVHHYFFDLTVGEASAFTLTSTLVWERQLNETDINNLDLFLYTASGSLVDSSVSTVDNVEHLFTQNLAPGRYDLEVVKHSGTPGSTNVSHAENYALAFKFSPVPEPSSFMMIGVGAAWLILRRRRR